MATEEGRAEDKSKRPRPRTDQSPGDCKEF